MVKSTFWKSYWHLTMDPFSDEPLYYNSEQFDRLLVRYAPIQEVDKILEDFYEQKRRLMRKRYYVIGLRGMGKTTILHYILNRTHKRPRDRIMSIYVNNVHIKDPDESVDPAHDPEKLRLNFLLRTIEALFSTVFHVLKGHISEQKHFERTRAKYFELKGQNKIDQATAESLIKDYLNRLKKDFDLFILLYDELDKIEEYTTVLRFLRSSQGLFETLSEYGCVVFLSGIPDFSKMLRSSEYSGVSGHNIMINMWSVKDAKSLIKNRLKYAMFSGRFPFRDNVIEAICKKAECRPRLIQGHVKDALIWGAYNSKKIIDQKFLNKVIWDDSHTMQFVAKVKTSKELQEAVSILRKVYDPDRDDPATYFLLIKTYDNIKLRPTKLKERYGIDMEMRRFDRLMYILSYYGAIVGGEVGGKKYYVVSNKIVSLFDYVKKTLKAPLEYLPRVAKVDLAEIKEEEISFNMRNEITKIFVMNPQHRYKKTELVKEIMKNADSKKRAKKHYKTTFDEYLHSRLKSSLGQVLHRMKKEGTVVEVMQDRRITFQYSEPMEEISWAASLRIDEDVIQHFQSALKTLRDGDLCGSIPNLRMSIEKALRHLASKGGIELPDKPSLDTISPINSKLFSAKIYDQGVKTMIDAFTIEANPIIHGRIKLRDIERAKNLVDRARMIIQQIYRIKKSIRKPK